MHNPNLYDPYNMKDGYKAPEPIEIDPGESKQAGRYVLANTGSQKVYVTTGHSNPEPSVDEELQQQIEKLNIFCVATNWAIGRGYSDENLKGLQQGWREDIMHLLTNRIEAARLDEQNRTGRLKYQAGDGDLVFFQHDGSTTITQQKRIEQLEAQLQSTNKQESK